MTNTPSPPLLPTKTSMAAISASCCRVNLKPRLRPRPPIGSNQTTVLSNDRHCSTLQQCRFPVLTDSIPHTTISAFSSFRSRSVGEIPDSPSMDFLPSCTPSPTSKIELKTQLVQLQQQGGQGRDFRSIEDDDVNAMMFAPVANDVVPAPPLPLLPTLDSLSRNTNPVVLKPRLSRRRNDTW